MAFSSGQAEMNVTPLIDILLVLIIIFMIIVPVAPTGLEANIPREPTDKTEPSLVRTIVIQLHMSNTKEAVLSINEEPVAWENLRAKLIDIYKERAEKIAFVRADSEMPFEQVAQVIDIAHAAGVSNVGLMR
jgi:biopolymer transport protein TolR